MRLIDTITDGDIRRAILDSVQMEAEIRVLSDRKRARQVRAPITATPSMSDAEVLELMRVHKILHVPVVDEDNRVCGLKLMRDLIPSQGSSVEAMIMAGGFGTRLMPLTESIPKPMLKVGGRPILEHIIGKLKSADVQKVVLATHHLPELIHEHFGSGEGFGLEINYVHESSPLGTAGALGLLDPIQKPLLVMNGDIMTNVDFKAMIAFHEEHAAELTVGVARYQFQVPYGVVECEGVDITGLSEKPQISVFVSAGIYLLSPKVVSFVEKGQRLDMPDLINRILEQKGRVVSFPIVEYWLDVGAPREYEKAQKDYE